MNNNKEIRSGQKQSLSMVRDNIDQKNFNSFDSVEMEFTRKQNEKWLRLSEWIHCMCVVTFDLELGQAMEVIYPEQAVLTEQEKTNICYLAFPDSNSGCMGDTQFHVRLRSSIPTADNCYNLNGGHPLSATHRQFNTQCITVQKADISHFWGFVYFRQKRDKTIPRGYFQKSFIILTRLPFFNLFNELVSMIAPKYFAQGFVVLQSACEQISTWPALKADGDTLSLHILGTVFQTIIPRSNSKIHTSCPNISSIAPSTSNNININKSNNGYYGSYNVNDNVNENVDAMKKYKSLENCFDMVGPTLPPQILISVHEIDIFRSLSSVLSNIYTLWELVLIAEPIVVMGTSPADCSHMVQSLVSMIAPLEYCAESRPYFTIHDSEFKEFTYESSCNSGSNNLMSEGVSAASSNNKASKPPPALIIGVTNPFFGKLLKNWPHMIRLLDNQQATVARFSKSLTKNNSKSSSISTAIISSLNLGDSRNSYSDLMTNNKKRVIGNDVLPGFYTKYSPFLKKDKALIKKVTLGMKTKRPEQVQSALLRRNLLELTQSFMIPLERYMASLMPLQRDISPFKSAPNPSQFKQDDFLATLEQSGPQLTSQLKGNWKELYKRFFKSPNFKGWYETRHKELQQKLQTLQLEALSDADLNQWAQGKQEVEIIDMIIKLKQKLTLCSNCGDGYGDSSNMKTISSYSTENSTSSGKLDRTKVLAGQNQQYSTTGDNIILKSSTRDQLLRQLENIKQSLPDDLKIILSDK